jgi:hypothetical protein
MDDPYLDTYLFPRISGVMVSIIAFGKLCGGAKTLGWEHSNGTLKKKWFRKPWNSALFHRSVLRKMCSGKWRKGGGGFMKEGIAYKCSPNQLTRATTITLVWDGA